MYLLGFDLGSSSIKAALVDARTHQPIAAVQYPETEMEILAPQAGFAEQNPELWWDCICKASKKLLKKANISPDSVKSIGIAYQMHGLVCVDKNGKALRPSIIWCDSRAVAFGAEAFQTLGEQYCLEHYLNSPGNFTASKLAWVRTHEPEIFAQIHKIMLPGDYIAYRMTGEILTTASGLSEGILWDFQANAPAARLAEHFGFDLKILPALAPAFGEQGKLTKQAAKSLGLAAGTPVTYRAGDQPNNALSLNALNPGEIAATGGTSGVVYGIVGHAAFDPQNRVNSFAHVNHRAEQARIGVLLCINGAGIQYSWLRHQMGGSLANKKPIDYPSMEKMAQSVPIGADGLCLIPFGNGAERMLGNRDIGAQVHNLQFNRHRRAHFFRAGLEGVAFSFVFGVQVMREMGLDVSVMRVGNDNLFQSSVFSETIATLLGCRIEMLRTTGAIGAAIASGVGIGVFRSPEEGLGNLSLVQTYEPSGQTEPYRAAYENWQEKLQNMLNLA